MLKQRLWESIRSARMVTHVVFNPPKDAPSGQIRLYGAFAWLAGLVIIIAGAVFFSLLGQWGVVSRFTLIASIFPLAGFGLMMVGAYRALTGINVQVSADITKVSMLRVINGLFALIVSLLLVGGAATAFLYYLLSIGIDPRLIFQ